jgi:hypothetical protein
MGGNSVEMYDGLVITTCWLVFAFRAPDPVRFRGTFHLLTVNCGMDSALRPSEPPSRRAHRFLAR